MRRTGKLSIPLQRLGRWWDAGEEVDLVGLIEDANAIVLGGVKWSLKSLGTEILRRSREKAPRLEWGRAGRREAFVQPPPSPSIEAASTGGAHLVVDPGGGV